MRLPSPSSWAALTLAPALVLAQPGGPWWGSVANCAHNCLSSAWSSGTAWPAPSSFCGPTAAPVANCIAGQCAATPGAFQSFSSVSSSLCSAYTSCVAAGSTGVHTITAGPGGGPPGWGPGGWGPGGPGGPPGGARHWGPGGSSYGPGVYTVTGCPWAGSPWFGSVGPGGVPGGPGWNGWGPTGTGWTWFTQLSTITATYTSNGFVVTTTGVATVAEAISNGFTTMTTYGIGATANAAQPRPTGDAGVKVMGALLGGVVAVAGLL